MELAVVLACCTSAPAQPVPDPPEVREADDTRDYAQQLRRRPPQKQ